MDKVLRRFYDDPVFHAVVMAMESVLVKYQLSPSEMREAVMLACVNFEQERNSTAIFCGAGENIAQQAAAQNTGGQ